MPYIALYRQWRPLVFDDVVEQEHIVKSLKYSVSTERIAHAYLFCGTRGTGKTTMAQILSRAVNCLNPNDGNPCNKCEICKDVLSGSLLDVVEIDAASNNSVDNVRDIRDEVVYTPARAKYKVYIIDEVHMLSTGAFNALLKTLEEPPSYVIFILATTEPHKLPATILSRCQRYDFRRITVDSIASRLNIISKTNGIDVEDEALKLIARLSDGALRDALSILDQCISLGNKNITYTDVLSITGVVNEGFISAFVDSISNKDISNLINLINELVMEGKDISQFVSALIVYYRNLLLCKLLNNAETIIESSKNSINTMKQQAARLEKDEIIYIIKELSELESSLKWATHPRIILEVALIKICTNTSTINDANIINSANNSNVINSANTINNTGNSIGDARQSHETNHKINHKLDKDSTPTEDNNQSGPKPNVKNEAIEPDNTLSDKINLDKIWGEVLKELMKAGKGPLCFILKTAKIHKVNKGCIALILPGNYEANKDIVSQPDNIKLIEKILKAKLGTEIRVKCLLEKDIENIEQFEPVSSDIKYSGDSFNDSSYSDLDDTFDDTYANNKSTDDSTDNYVGKISDFATSINAPFNIYDK